MSDTSQEVGSAKERFFNIKERQEKVYVLADDEMHKIIKPLKDDIKWLIMLVEEAGIFKKEKEIA